jgi:uncharacterized protein (UPF0332 family)
MKPETAEHRDKAHRCLAGAKTIAAAELPDVTAREAYLAVHHAAEAYIFERTDKAAKTHRGVRSQFARESPASDANSLPFSPRSTNSKRSPLRHQSRHRRDLAGRCGFRDQHGRALHRCHCRVALK